MIAGNEARANLYRRIGVAVTVVLFLGVSIYFLRAVLTPILAAFIIAYFLDPIIDWFEARGIPRSVAIVLLLLGVLLIFALFGLLVVPRVAVEFGRLIEKIGVFVGQAGQWIQVRFHIDLPTSFQAALDRFGTEIKNLAPEAASPLAAIVQYVFSGTLNVVLAIVGTIFIPVFAFYFLRDFDVITARLFTLVPFNYRPWVRSTFREIDDNLASFIRGQLTVAAVKGTLYAILLSIAGVKLSVIIGFIIGFGSIIPYFGAIVGGTLTTVMISVDFQGWEQVFWVVMCFVGIEALDGIFITPKLLGDKVGLSPVAVIVALLVSGQLFGFAGILLAVPLAAVVRILVARAVETYRGTTFFSGPTDRPIVIPNAAEIDDYVREARCRCGGSFKIEERTPEGAALICARCTALRRLEVAATRTNAMPARTPRPRASPRPPAPRREQSPVEEKPQQVAPQPPSEVTEEPPQAAETPQETAEESPQPTDEATTITAKKKKRKKKRKRASSAAKAEQPEQTKTPGDPDPRTERATPDRETERSDEETPAEPADWAAALAEPDREADGSDGSPETVEPAADDKESSS